eukprot:GFYU01003111.1.p1 GENE.GFYU01003111.1~~GFYU01003111.1.p1  ORF type:complete len:305 (-),score=8.62 GFYU01003111.1:115-1029(-)
MTGLADTAGTKQPHHQLRIFIAGGVAGCVAKTAISPFERAKILYQVGSKQYPYTGVFPGVFRTIHQIFKNEGVRGMWKGNSSTVARIFPYAAIQFTAFENFKAVTKDIDTVPRVWLNLVGGACAGATAVVVTYPLDLVRARLAVQVHVHYYEGIADCLRKLYAEGSVAALYKGANVTLLGIFPYAGINFATYEQLKGWYQTRANTTEWPITMRLICGGLAGAIGQTATYPLDVLRRRMQTSGMGEGGTVYNYKGAWQGVSEIYRKEGVRALFRGIGINYLKVTPLVGLSFATFEQMKIILDVKP